MDEEKPVLAWPVLHNAYKVLYLQVDAKQQLQELDIFCPVCYTVSRDLAALTLCKHPTTAEDAATLAKRLVIKWDVHLSELADSAERGCCHFCGFMATRFFNDPLYSFKFTLETNSPVTGCCSSAEKGQITDQIQQAVKHLREHAKRHDRPCVTLVGETFDNERPNLGKVRWTAAFTEIPGGDVRELLGMRTEIVLELYAKKGALIADLIYSKRNWLIDDRGPGCHIYPNATHQHRSVVKRQF
jgi:hypothetical protein